MSYLVLARKWRPQHFNEVVGQRHVVRTLQNALKLNRVAHAMIFSGVRGVGKTTLARVMAKALNCQSETDDKPCNQCESCREITEGSALDLHEIDGASNRGIQEIRELKENIRFFPTKSPYKIIIIDEVHMLTTEAFNALLKTLEEPPEHIFFMFATTELHKVPVTILSRCQRYELQRIPFNELIDFFKKIAAEEKVAISDYALETIAREAGGSVRDGLSLLDQIFSFSGNQVTDEDITQVLGLVDRNVFSVMAKALLAEDLPQCLKLLDKTYSSGIDLKRFANDLLFYFRSLLIYKTCPNPEELLDLSDREMESLRETAAAHSKETLYNFFHFLLKGAEEINYSSHPRLALEMTFIKAAQTGQVVPVSTLLEKVDGLLQNTGEPQPAAATIPQPPPRKETVSLEQTVKPSSATLAKTPPPPIPPAPKVAEKKADYPSAPQTPAPNADTQPASREVRKHWPEFIEYVMDRKKWMAHVLRLCAGTEEEETNLILRYDTPSDCKVLQEPDNMKSLTEFAQDFFQREMKIKISFRGGDAEGQNGQENGGPQEERRALANDPLVLAATDTFGGQVTGIRTGPRFR